ncbi:hypothetical protein D3C85_1160540 [compost metagenome]
MGLELHHPLVLGTGRNGIAEQRAAGAHHVQARLGHFQGGEGVGRVQGEPAAIHARFPDQPLGLLVEGRQALAHVVLVFHRVVGHQRHHLQALLAHDGQGVLAALLGVHLHAVAAHAAGVQRQVDAQGAPVAFGDGRCLAGEIGIADQLLDLVLQGFLQLGEGAGAHPYQLTLEAAGADHAGFLVAGDGDAGHVQGDHRGHQQADTMAVGVGLEHRAQLRLAVEFGLQGADIVFEGSLVDLHPGVAGLCGQRRLAVVQRHRRRGMDLALPENQTEGQGEQGTAERHG